MNFPYMFHFEKSNTFPPCLRYECACIYQIEKLVQSGLFFRITFHNDTFFLNYCIGSFQQLQMAFLKVNCKEPVESIPTSNLLLFSPGCFKLFVILSKLLICDYTTLSCVCVNSLSQTIVNIAILKCYCLILDLKKIFICS